MLGLVTGLTYALLGVGLVMIYKTSRVLNFAHGEMGALGAGFIPWLVIRHHTPYWLAFVLAIAVAAGAGALTELVLIRKLSRSSRLIVMVQAEVAERIAAPVGQMSALAVAIQAQARVRTSLGIFLDRVRILRKWMVYSLFSRLTASPRMKEKQRHYEMAWETARLK